MIDLLGVHRLDEAEFVGDRSGMRHQFADSRAALPVLFEFEKGIGDREGFLPAAHPGKALSISNGVGQVLASNFIHQWLVVEQVDLGWPAGLEEIDYAFCFWGEVREFGFDFAFYRIGLRLSGQTFLGKKRPQRCGSNSSADGREKVPTSLGEHVFRKWICWITHD